MTMRIWLVAEISIDRSNYLPDSSNQVMTVDLCGYFLDQYPLLGGAVVVKNKIHARLKPADVQSPSIVDMRLRVQDVFGDFFRSQPQDTETLVPGAKYRQSIRATAVSDVHTVDWPIL